MYVIYIYRYNDENDNSNNLKPGDRLDNQRKWESNKYVLNKVLKTTGFFKIIVSRREPQISSLMRPVISWLEKHKPRDVYFILIFICI